MYKSEILDKHKNTIMESTNASFFEYIFPCKSNEGPSLSKRMYKTMNEDSQDQNHEQEVEDEPRRNKRIMIEKSFSPNFLTICWKMNLKASKKL